MTVVGQCMGAGRSDEAVYYTKKLMLLSYIAMAALKTVKHHHFVALIQQELRGDTADVTGAACDKNLHNFAKVGESFIRFE